MSRILDVLEEVLCQMDDVLIYGKTQGDHDLQLSAALTQIQAAGVTLNGEKSKFYDPIS